MLQTNDYGRFDDFSVFRCSTQCYDGLSSLSKMRQFFKAFTIVCRIILIDRRSVRVWQLNLTKFAGIQMLLESLRVTLNSSGKSYISQLLGETWVPFVRPTKLTDKWIILYNVKSFSLYMSLEIVLNTDSLAVIFPTDLSTSVASIVHVQWSSFRTKGVANEFVCFLRTEVKWFHLLQPYLISTLFRQLIKHKFNAMRSLLLAKRTHNIQTDYHYLTDLVQYSANGLINLRILVGKYYYCFFHHHFCFVI